MENYTNRLITEERNNMGMVRYCVVDRTNTPNAFCGGSFNTKKQGIEQLKRAKHLYPNNKWTLEAIFSIGGKEKKRKNLGNPLVKLTESDLHRIIKESVSKVLNEVALKGKSGKTYSLHGTDPESWGVMSRLRGGKNNYILPNTPQHYHGSRDENNWFELDDKAHPNLRSRNNANRIDAMMKRIDDKSKDIMAANESKLSRIVKESVQKILNNEVDGWQTYDDTNMSPEEKAFRATISPNFNQSAIEYLGKLSNGNTLIEYNGVSFEITPKGKMIRVNR